MFIVGLAAESLLDFLGARWSGLLPIQTWSYPIRTLLVLATLAIAWPFLSELKQPAKGRANLILSCLVGVFVFAIWITVGPLFRTGGNLPSSGAPWPNGEWQAGVWIAFRIFGAVALVPVIEEVFWRGYLMRRLDCADFASLSPELVSRFAVVASSFVFALAHRELLAAFVTGIIYAWLFQLTKNLWSAIAAHATTNLLLATYVLYTGKYEFW